MIFLSLGTHEDPFPRALEMARPLAEGEDRLVVQHGHTPPDPGLGDRVEWAEWLDYERMVELVRSSRAFVCHAGVGSVLTALSYGVTPVVLARRADLGEHLDDHQLQLVRRLAERELIVDPGEDLAAAVERAARLKGAPRGPGDQLRRAVAEATSRRGHRLPARWTRFRGSSPPPGPGPELP